MKKVKIRKFKKELDAKTELRHLGVLVERVGDDVKSIIEQFPKKKNLLTRN